MMRVEVLFCLLAMAVCVAGQGQCTLETTKVKCVDNKCEWCSQPGGRSW